MDIIGTVRAWCQQRVGCPYLYGGTGAACTVSYRRARMQQYPAYAAKMERNCQRLKRGAASCQGCPWADENGKGREAFDCAQFARLAMKQAGVSLVSGANSQWIATDWDRRGTIATLPRDTLCLVYRWDEDHMGHVGVYQGDGAVIHAKGHDYGVVRDKIEDVAFTHWGIPVGLYDEGRGEGMTPLTLPELRRTQSGEHVILLQALLVLHGLNIGSGGLSGTGIDGKFGGKTETAVLAVNNELGDAGNRVCTARTWLALLGGQPPGSAAEEPQEAAAQAAAETRQEAAETQQDGPGTANTQQDGQETSQARIVGSITAAQAAEIRAIMDTLEHAVSGLITD